MRRTTIFIEEEVERELKTLARRKGRPVAALVREAVAQYVVSARADGQPRLRFIAAGRSGREDIAERHEDLLFQPAPPAPPRARPTAKRPQGFTPPRTKRAAGTPARPSRRKGRPT
jgi:predicted transcriptional regulator